MRTLSVTLKIGLSKDRIGILWTFSRKDYTLQDCITPQIRTAWLQPEIASQHAGAHVHVSNMRRTHFCCRPTASPRVLQVLQLHRAVCLPLHHGFNMSMTTQERASASDKKEETKEPPLLVSPICAISDPSHLVQTGEGFLHTVLPMLCSHNLPGYKACKEKSDRFSNMCHLQPSKLFSFSPHKQESFSILGSSDNETSRSVWHFTFYASGWIN